MIVQEKVVQVCLYKMKLDMNVYSLRDYMRSESERSFDECQIRRARLKSLGLAYLSPQNKSLAQSFRYMRTKPTIIAFKTPSLENCDYELPSTSNGGKQGGWWKITITKGAKHEYKNQANENKRVAKVYFDIEILQRRKKNQTNWRFQKKERKRKEERKMDLCVFWDELKLQKIQKKNKKMLAWI